MAISDNIQEVAETIRQQRLVPPGNQSELGRQIQAKALKAIYGGPVEWVEYMQQFAKTPGELARLIPTDGTMDDKRKLARAYLLCDGMCGETTTQNLRENVTKDLD